MGNMYEEMIKSGDTIAQNSISMAQNWGKVGTSDYVSQLDDVKKLEEEAAASREYYNQMMAAGNYPEDIKKTLEDEMKTKEISDTLSLKIGSNKE